MTSYNKRTWLNPEHSVSTGSVVAYDGEVKPYVGEKYRCTYFQVSDCSVSARLVKSADDSTEDFINKMRLLKQEIALFINHLENN